LTSGTLTATSMLEFISIRTLIRVAPGGSRSKLLRTVPQDLLLET